MLLRHQLTERLGLMGDASRWNIVLMAKRASTNSANKPHFSVRRASVARERRMIMQPTG